MTQPETSGDSVAKTTRRQVTNSSSYSPVQFVLGIVGALMAVVGVVAMLRIGFTDFSQTAKVGWFAHTGWLALLETLLGLSLLSTSWSAAAAKMRAVSAGAFLSIGALVLLIEPGATASMVGDSKVAGATYMVVGVVLMVAGWASPTIFSRTEKASTELHSKTNNNV